MISVPSLEVGHLVERADFDLAGARHGVGAALHPGDGLVHVLDFPEPEAGDHLLGLGERSVDDRTAGTIERNTLTFRFGNTPPVNLLTGLSGASGLDLGDVDLLHSQHRLHRAFGPGRIGITERFQKLFRHNLPGNAVAVLQPATLNFDPAVGELFSKVIDFGWAVAMDDERDGFADFEYRATV